MNREFRKKRESDRGSILSDGSFALGLVSGIGGLLVIFLFLDTWGLWFTREEILEVAPAISALLVAMVSLFVSFRALVEQRRMRQAGTDPVLIAHLSQRKDEPMVITLNVSNVGAGAAMNVSIDVLEPEGGVDPDRMMTNVFDIKKGISVILQNDSISYSFGVGHKLLGGNSIPPFEVALEYQDIDGASYASSHTIDVSELSSRTANSPPITKIWRELEKLNKNLSR